MDFLAGARSKRVRKKLYNLRPREISMVDDPANMKPILVLKGKRSMTDMEAMRQAIAQTDPNIIGAADATIEAIAKAASAGMMAQGAQVDGYGGLSDQAQAALKAVARLLAPYKDEISDADMDALQDSLGMAQAPNSDADDSAPVPPPPMPMQAPQVPGSPAQAMSRAPGPPRAPMLPPQLRVRKAAQTMMDKGKKEPPDDADEKEMETDDAEADDKKVTDSKTKPYKSKSGGVMADSETKVEKSADGKLEEIFKRAAALEAQNQELVAKSAQLESELAVEREDRLQREYLVRAEEYRGLGDPASVAKVLKSMHGASDEAQKEFEAVLKAANQRVRATEAFGGSLFSESGSRLGGNTGGSALGKLDALVDSQVSKSTGKSREQIYAEIMKSAEGKALYRQSEAEAGRGVL
jgi:hypothetical protein